MQTLAFIFYSLLLMALVIGGLIHDAPVGEQPEPNEPKFIRPKDRHLARRLADSIREKHQRRN